MRHHSPFPLFNSVLPGLGKMFIKVEGGPAPFLASFVQDQTQ